MFCTAIHRFRTIFLPETVWFDSCGLNSVDKLYETEEILFSSVKYRNFFSIMHKCYINLLGGSFGLIGCLGRISSPCISIVYCSGDISNASSTERGQLKAPLLSLLYGNSNARIYRIRWRFCCLYVSYSSIFIPIQHFSRLI